MKVYMVSACLLGIMTRYDGNSKPIKSVIDFCKRNICVPFCPEQLGGMPTPRPACFFKKGSGGDVITGNACVIEKESGIDRTCNFLKGAEMSLKIAALVRPEAIIMQDKSPSCGKYYVDIEGTESRGMGVATALLIKHGYKIITGKEV